MLQVCYTTVCGVFLTDLISFLDESPDLRGKARFEAGSTTCRYMVFACSGQYITESFLSMGAGERWRERAQLQFHLPGESPSVCLPIISIGSASKRLGRGGEPTTKVNHDWEVIRA